MNRQRILVQVDPELEDLIPGFLESRHKDVESMRQALDRRDYDDIRVLGHRMKGSGGGYGFETISQIGSALEKAALEENDAEIQRHLKELAFYLEHVEVTYA